MIWAGITSTRRTQAVSIQGNLNGRRYIDEILTPHVVPMSQQHGNGFILQDDNARPHRAHIVADQLAMNVLPRMSF